MKKIAVLFLVASVWAQQENTEKLGQTQNNQNQQVAPQKPVDPDADIPYVVLQEFGKALGHFGNIVSDPKNGKNVGVNMVGIFGNIISIAAQAFKRKHPGATFDAQDLEEMFLEVCSDPEFRKQLFTVAEEEATRVKRSIRSEA